MQDSEVRLNAAQQAAVDITDGPVLVVAGAGTGKTRVIVERITRLIRSDIPASSILALTFTEKAAGEMLDRISGSDSVAFDATIATYNGFGNDILQTYGAEYGLGTLRLLGDTGQLVFLREHLDEFELDYFSPVSNPSGQLKNLASYVSLLKQRLIDPTAYKRYADTLPSGDDAEKLEQQKHQELAQFYELYLKLCRTEQVIDYDDQIYLTIELLRARPNVLKQLQERFRYIMVDEFQDTNPMQSALVDLLAGKAQNVMVVGDDDQSIYGWRGATLANILDFKVRYPKAKEITLIENYRSTQSILDNSYRLIQHNNPHRLEMINQLNKKLHANIENGNEPQLQHFTTHEAELVWVAHDIKRRLDAGQSAASIAVLARRNQGVVKAHEMLELFDVPHAVAGLGNDIYTQPAVKQLLEALVAIADPLDSLALFHVLSGPLFSLDISSLAQLSSTAKHQHDRLADLIRESDDEALKAALITVETWRTNAVEQSVGTIAYKIIDESGWKQRLSAAAEKDIVVYTEVQALSKLFKTFKEFERSAGVPSVQNYVLNLPTLQAAGSSFEDPTLDISDSMVNVLSVHRAKGLEWDTVYVIDCTEGSFPMRAFGTSLTLPEELKTQVTDADAHIAEERRLMYVAATRARRDLVISYADRHGKGIPRKASRFIEEMFGNKPATHVQDDDSHANLEAFSPRASDATMELPPRMSSNNRIVLSVSQIETWLRCPRDFYYRYVLAMPLPPAPHLTRGTLIHGVIERIHRGREQGHVPKLDELMDDVIANLPSAGYESKRSRDRARQQTIRTIESVYERFLRDDLPIETEWPFTLEMPDIPLTIRGKIDAVYQLEKGIEIRDFKTGTSVRSLEQAKSRATGSQQLTLYALAWQILRDELPAKVSLDFVETGQLYGVRKQAKSLETMQSRLAQMVIDLKAGVYPLGRDHDHCMHPKQGN
ncbi:ATP-dependent helicase [Candidatus Saccharibacteria bacterium]|nr:ATP-dependent helicase [Candidatus Saccharibacteria bacterium]